MIKQTLKNVRDFIPINHLVTASFKYSFGLRGKAPEVITKYIPRAGSFSVKLPNGKNLKLWSKADECVTNLVYWHGWDAHEPETSRLFFQMAQEAKVIFDIGAHIGYYALLAAKAQPQAQVFAFEPLPIVFERLKHNLALNNLNNVQAFDFAAGTHGHIADFYHVPQGIPSSSGLSFEFHSRTGVEITATKVRVIALDDFIEEQKLTRLDLIKMDTEETEPDVLNGMLVSLKKFRPKIICEVLKKENPELEKVFSNLNYRYYRLTTDGPVEQTQISAVGLRDNFLFLPS